MPRLTDLAASPDFDIPALYAALDARRQALDLSWPEAARAISEVFRNVPARRISPSTLTGMRDRRVLEGDGVLQMLRWLDCAPEHFVPGGTVTQRLPALGTDEILRFDTRQVYEAIDARRIERGMSWAEVARELPGWSPQNLRRMSQGGRTGFPQIVRIAVWLGRPVASFTRAFER